MNPKHQKVALQVLWLSGFVTLTGAALLLFFLWGWPWYLMAVGIGVSSIVFLIREIVITLREK